MAGFLHSSVKIILLITIVLKDLQFTDLGFVTGCANSRNKGKISDNSFNLVSHSSCAVPISQLTSNPLLLLLFPAVTDPGESELRSLGPTPNSSLTLCPSSLSLVNSDARPTLGVGNSIFHSSYDSEMLVESSAWCIWLASLRD